MKPRTRTLLIVGAIVVGALIVADHLARMDERLFGQSQPAARALMHYFAGDYAGAARLYREALRRRAASAASEPALSWDAFVSGDLEQAEIQARRESSVAPTDPEPLLTLAEIALARRDSVTAATHAARVLELRRDDYDALLITAVAQARQRAYHAAIKALGRALRYDRVERRITVFLAVLEATGELDHRPDAERPNCVLAHLHRYLRIYDPSHARLAARYAQRAIDVGDDPDDAYVTLGVIHTRQGHPTRAFTAFQQALARNPRNTAALLGAARFRENRGELDEAYRLIRAAFEANPDDRFVVAVLHEFLVEKLERLSPSARLG
jgi:tetratricopeptide (TPR) repeat protein